MKRSDKCEFCFITFELFPIINNSGRSSKYPQPSWSTGTWESRVFCKKIMNVYNSYFIKVTQSVQTCEPACTCQACWSPAYGCSPRRGQSWPSPWPGCRTVAGSNPQAQGWTSGSLDLCLQTMIRVWFTTSLWYPSYQILCIIPLRTSGQQQPSRNSQHFESSKKGHLKRITMSDAQGWLEIIQAADKK